MPSAVVHAAFMDTLSGWTETEVIGLNGVTVPPDDGDSFLVVQYPIVDGSKPGLGRRFFEDGAARLVLNIQTGSGEDGMTTGFNLADQLASMFRETILAPGVQTFAPSAPIINDTNDEGNWFSLSIIVPYRYQFDDGGSNSPS